MDRKQFIVNSCHACIAGVGVLLLPTMSGCGSTSSAIYKAIPVNNQLEIPLQLFEKSTFRLIRPTGWNYDIGVRKSESGNYSAMLMRCTHMDNALNYSQDNFTCPLHGSRFGKDGEVLKGPAEVPLKKYITSLKNDQLIITL